MRGPEEIVVEAGRRAICYYLDMGECLFCNVTNAKKGQEHEEHCTFYGVPSAALSLLSELARLFAAEAKATKDIKLYFYYTYCAVDIHCAAGFKKQEE